MEKRAKRLIKNTAILSFGTFCTKAIMFILLPIITRLVSKKDYGTFDLLLTYVILLTPIVSLGIGDGAFRFLLDNNVKDLKKNRDKIISSTFWVNFIGILLSIVVIYVISKINIDINYYIIPFSLYMISQIFFDTLGKILRGLKKTNLYTISNIIFVLGIAIGVYVFVWKLQLGLIGLLYSYFLGNVISDLLMICGGQLFRTNILTLDKKITKELLVYSIPLILTGISWWVIGVSDRTIVTFFLGAEVNAIYSIATKIPGLCQTFYNVFQLSWLENASDTIDDVDKVEYYTKIYNNIIIILSTITIGILSCNFIFFNYIFSKEYYYAYNQTPILLIATFFNLLSAFYGGIYVAQKKGGKQGRTVLYAAIINIIFDILLVKKIGVYAASISTLIAYFILFVIRKIDISREIKIDTTRKSKLCIVIMLIYFGLVYIKNSYLNVTMLLLAIFTFLVFNKEIVKNVLKRLKIIK